MTEKTIILARPSVYIVEEMKNLLSRNGYTPYVINDIEDIKNSPASTKGVIISTAVTSGVGTIDEIISSVRQSFPSVPMAFTTLQSFDTVVKLLDNKLKTSPTGPEFILADKDSVSNKYLGEINGYLVIRKQDLVADNEKFCDQLIKRHFS